MSYWKTLSFFLLLLILLGFAGCAPKAKSPMPIKEYGKIEQSGNTRLMVLLRGIGGDYTDFEKYGLIEEVRSRDMSIDIIVPDAHYGYYKTESIAVRLKEDVIDPARARGYQEIWLAGFSMGGLGSLFYLRDNPGEIDGVMLISPFLGWDSILKEIEIAGGIKNWQPENSKVSDWQFLIWSFVKNYTSNTERHPPIYLGYGDSDSLAGRASQTLGNALDHNHVFSIPGGHDYPTFKALWSEHLNKLQSQDGSKP